MNYIAIASATIAAMIVGWLWYGPIFGKTWNRLTGNPVTNPAVIYPLTLIATVATGFVIALAAAATSTALGLELLPAALLAGVALWLGFGFARQLIIALFERKAPAHFLINTGHDLAVAVVMAAIIGVMGR